MSKRFPFWSGILPPPEDMFRTLESTKGIVSIHDDEDGVSSQIMKRRYPEDHRVVDGLANHFTEPPRIQASFNGGKTPHEVHMHLSETDRAYPTMSEETRRECVYMWGRECNLFNPTYAKWIYQTLGGYRPRVLDLSAGWGDRAIAAAAAGAELYHACDPNPLLESGYTALTDMLKKVAPKTQVSLTIAPAEEYEIPRSEYDIALMSCPFFTLEVYVDERRPEADSQSTVRYPDYPSWRNGFLGPYLAKAYNALRPGGWLVLYISNVRVADAPHKSKQRRLTKEIPLGDDAEAFLLRAGALPGHKFGLLVDAKAAKRGGNVRWATAWFKPPQVPLIYNTFAENYKNHCATLPPLVVQTMQGKKGILRIVRDDRLPFGLRSRVPNITVASDPVRGIVAFGQGEDLSLALAAFIAQSAQCACTIYLHGSGRKTPTLMYALAMGATISDKVSFSLEDAARHAMAAADTPTDLVPYGWILPGMEETYGSWLKHYADRSVLTSEPIRNLWCYCPTGRLGIALKKSGIANGRVNVFSDRDLSPYLEQNVDQWDFGDPTPLQPMTEHVQRMVDIFLNDAENGDVLWLG